MPFVSVATYAPPRVGMLAAGLVVEVFDAHVGGPPCFDFALCTDRPGKVPTDVGIPLTVEHGLERIVAADLVLALPRADLRTATAVRPSTWPPPSPRTARTSGSPVSSPGPVHISTNLCPSPSWPGVP
ncbi:hypothetical protein [Streptomyces globisporus]|uniref:hypothetical protein n=1 Tax=Streptomyces globisporus TaxID=1908 RepID=UPI000AC38DBF|nr:hypothetical protein [Streptomyces globisporus]